MKEREWWSGNKGVVGGMGSGFVGLHRKDTLTGELFTISRNELAPERANPPESARSHHVKTSEYSK